MTFKSRVTTAIATGAVLLYAMAPITLADTITVTGNGALSANAVNSTSNQTTVVNQTNNAAVSNNVSSSASTGGNSADFNTGGNTTIKTGDANNTVNVSTAVNLNKASVDPCACDSGAANVTISGNGALSENTANVGSNNSVVLSQNNNASISNNIDASSKTGANDAGFNTGGNTTIWTGNASTNVDVLNAANANIANVGGGAGAGNSSSSVNITGNGALSENAVDLFNNSAVVVAQDNNAAISNNVNADAKTGKNSADFNTGGSTLVKTGNANTDVNVDNLVNFNAADVNCGCVLGGVDVKIGGNGAESLNVVDTEANNGLWVFGDNLAALSNDVDGVSKTGLNDAGFDTGHVNGDPTVWTGESNSSTSVSNTGNVNVFDQNGLSLPSGFSFSFDLAGLLGFMSFFHHVV